MLFLLIHLGCSHPVPPQPEAAAPAPPPTVPTTPAERVAWMVANDPLVRRPRLTYTPEDPAVAAYVSLAGRETVAAAEWWALEEAHRGTLAVPLARGARLAEMEALLADPEGALDVLTPTTRPAPMQGRTRQPLAWAGVNGVADLLPAAERAVMLGWLDAPGLDLAPVGRLLAQPEWDRVASAPAGALVRARSEGLADPARGASGAADLVRATVYVLGQSAADTAKEQDVAQKQREALRTELAVAVDPRGPLLARARASLTADAASDVSTGLALLAIEGERLARACPDAPCTGLDRVRMIAATRTWGGPAAVLAEAWITVALKDARDHLEVAYDQPSYPSAMDEVVEALVGLGIGPLDRSLLELSAPGPSVHLTLVRALGAGDFTSREAMSTALDRRLERVSQAALDALTGSALSPADVSALREPLERIHRRAALKAGPTVPVVRPPR